LFITTHYPSCRYPNYGTFVEQLVTAIARRGHECSVIHPATWHRYVIEKVAELRGAPGPNRGEARVIRPRFFSMGVRIGPLRTARPTRWGFHRAVHRATKRLHSPPDLIYAHFLWPAGVCAVRLGSRLGIPAFVAVGESVHACGGPMWSTAVTGVDAAAHLLKSVAGVIAVSSLLKRKLVDEVNVDAEKIRVFPNGVDRTRFCPRDRHEMRRRHNLPSDRFLVAFAGHFTHRKGVLRVAEAVRGLPGVGAVLLGSGPLEPSAREILFKGPVPHQVVPELLSAADLFVLPTLAEGSCNSLIEAMACGLPVVSSRGEFNDDLLNDQVALRIDPNDVEAIRHAIVTLKENPEQRQRMAASAIEHSRKFDIEQRVDRILAWTAERTRRFHEMRRRAADA